MRLHLTGTGDAAGWPRPGCPCASCLTAARAGARRAPTAAVVDGVLTLDAGGAPGPPATLALSTPDPTPSGPAVRTLARTGDLEVLALASRTGPGALVVRSPSFALLWAPHGFEGTEQTWAVLQEYPTALVALGGAGVPADRPPRFAHQLAGLRAAGALTDGALTVAVGLGHHSPPDLPAWLARWGACAVADGTTVDVGVLPAAEGPPRRTLVLGPSSSGKSAAAERLLAAEPTVVYAATAATAPGDPEWVRRIADHRSRRPRRWSTLERPDLVRLMSEPGPPALVDSVGSWLTGVLDANGAWDDAIGWRERTLEEVDRVVEAWAGAQRTLVAVGEEVGWGVVPATPAGRVFRDVLGRANQLLAARSEQVLLVVAGRVLDLAPSPGAAGAWP